jgi:hypothetical protein
VRPQFGQLRQHQPTVRRIFCPSIRPYQYGHLLAKQPDLLGLVETSCQGILGAKAAFHPVQGISLHKDL